MDKIELSDDKINNFDTDTASYNVSSYAVIFYLLCSHGHICLQRTVTKHTEKSK